MFKITFSSSRFGVVRILEAAAIFVAVLVDFGQKIVFLRMNDEEKYFSQGLKHVFIRNFK